MFMSENLPKALIRAVLVIMLSFLLLGCVVERLGSGELHIEYAEGLPWWLCVLAAVFSLAVIMGLQALALR